MATASKLDYAAHWRQLEATLPPEQRSRTKCREGRIRPYRPCPIDFREKYIELGWHYVDAHYRAHWRTIARWIDETGRLELKAARAAYVKAHGLLMMHEPR